MIKIQIEKIEELPCVRPNARAWWVAYRLVVDDFVGPMCERRIVKAKGHSDLEEILAADQIAREIIDDDADERRTLATLVL